MHALMCTHTLRAQVYQGGEDTGGKRVYVGNINYEVTQEELKGLFKEVSLCACAARQCTAARLASKISAHVTGSSSRAAAGVSVDMTMDVCPSSRDRA